MHISRIALLYFSHSFFEFRSCVCVCVCPVGLVGRGGDQIVSVIGANACAALHF